MTEVELTAAQRRIVDHGSGPARLLGPAGSGKTTALVARWLRLAESLDAARVLVLCRDRSAADRFRDAVVADLTGGYDALPITTFHGLAFDVATRHGPPVSLVTGAEQWAIVRQLLSRETATQWPTLHPFLGRAAFDEQVADALLHYQGSFLGAEEIRTHARAAGVQDRWDELAAFAERYLAHLGRIGAADASGILVMASLALRQPDVLAAERSRWDAVLVDDWESATFATNRLLGQVAGRGGNVAVAGNPDAAIGSHRGANAVHLARFADRFGVAPEADVALDGSFRWTGRPELVLCRHPSIEPEAIAAELLAARDDGVAWSRMAVLVRRPRARARSVARALTRHGIPVAPAPGLVREEPVVRAVLDALRWVDGDEAALDRLLVSPVAGLEPADVRRLRRSARDTPLIDQPQLRPLVALRDALIARRRAGDDPAALAFEVWRRALTDLTTGNEPADQRALDALTAFLADLSHRVEANPGWSLTDALGALDGPDLDADPWVLPAGPSDAVSVVAVAAAAGREWDVVVIAGCVEGELPSVHAHMAFFDRALLAGPDVPTVAERRRRSLDEERRLFDGVARTRATRRTIATAALEPGVLISRFVEGWTQRDPMLLPAPGPDAVRRAPTAGTGAVFPDGTLRLSASALETYDECPLRYSYEYVLGVRSESGTAAELGSLTHDILETFLDPARAGERPHTRDALFELAAEKWTDGIARYAPQREQAWRDLGEMLELWWEHEGEGPRAPDVAAVEHQFAVAVGPHTLRGKIDRVDRVAGGIRIIDYKTGTSEVGEDDIPDDIQLAVYHLAAVRDPELVALGPPKRLELMYLRKMKRVEQPITEDHVEVTEARILETAAKILGESFEPVAGRHCDYCGFQRVCPLWPEGREVAG